MAEMKLTPLSEHLERAWGKVGTLERDEMEARLKEEADNYFIGEAIRNARLEQHLTQEQLGEKIGVKRAQISKFEKGKSISLASMRKIFMALGVVTATLDLGQGRKVALW